MRFPLGSKNLEVNGQGGGQPQSAPAQPSTPMGVNSMGQMVVPTVTDSSGSSRKIQTQEWQGAAEQQRQGFQREAGAAEIEAQNQVKLAEQQAPAYQAEQLRAAAEREQHIVRMAKIQQDIDARTKLHDQRVAATMQTPGGFWDDKNEGQKSMVRIGIWLSALGGGLAGQDNRAVSYLNTMIERDAKEKQARAERLYKQADIAKGYLADAYKARADELSDYNANVEAGWRAVAHDAESYAKTMLPQQLRAQADQKIAQINQKAAEANMKAQQELAVDVHSQHSVVQPTNMSQGGSGMSPEAATNSESFRQQADALKEMAGIVKKNPAALKIFQQAHRENLEAEELGKTSLGKTMSFFKGAGAAPLTLDDRIKKLAGDNPQLAKAARRINTLYPIMKTGEARFFDPVGPLGDAAQRGATEHMNLLTSSKEEFTETANWFADSFRKKATAIDESKIPLAQKEARRAGQQAGGQSVSLPPSVEKDYREALMVPRGHADYKEAQEYIANVKRKYPGVK